jgi:hypothetical protein
VKKDLFWKIISIIFIIWLFLFLKKESIYIFQPEKNPAIIVKVNKLTGSVSLMSLVPESKGWEKRPIKSKEKQQIPPPPPGFVLDKKEKK